MTPVHEASLLICSLTRSYATPMHKHSELVHSTHQNTHTHTQAHKHVHKDNGAIVRESAAGLLKKAHPNSKRELTRRANPRAVTAFDAVDQPAAPRSLPPSIFFAAGALVAAAAAFAKRSLTAPEAHLHMRCQTTTLRRR